MHSSVEFFNHENKLKLKVKVKVYLINTVGIISFFSFSLYVYPWVPGFIGFGIPGFLIHFPGSKGSIRFIDLRDFWFLGFLI